LAYGQDKRMDEQGIGGGMMNQKRKPQHIVICQGRNKETPHESTLPDTPGIDKYKMYEAQKKRLQSMGLKPFQYDIEISIITEQLGI